MAESCLPGLVMVQRSFGIQKQVTEYGKHQDLFGIVAPGIYTALSSGSYSFACWSFFHSHEYLIKAAIYTCENPTSIYAFMICRGLRIGFIGILHIVVNTFARIRKNLRMNGAYSKGNRSFTYLRCGPFLRYKKNRSKKSPSSSRLFYHP